MADDALHTLFHRKMRIVCAENPGSIQMMSDFYTQNEAKLIRLCRKHKDDKQYKRLKQFVEFEYSLRHNPPKPDEEETPPKMGLVAEATEPPTETRGNPDGQMTLCE